MSLKSWQDEFYPTNAIQFYAREKTLQNELEAAKHSLRKWQGLRKENLEKHSVAANFDELRDKDNFVSFSLRWENCSLCRLTSLKHELNYSIRCHLCPIARVQNNDSSEHCWPQYSEWKARQDPEPMISLLEKLVEELETLITEEQKKNEAVPGQL